MFSHHLRSLAPSHDYPLATSSNNYLITGFSLVDWASPGMQSPSPVPVYSTNWIMPQTLHHLRFKVCVVASNWSLVLGYGLINGLAVLGVQWVCPRCAELHRGAWQSRALSWRGGGVAVLSWSRGGVSSEGLWLQDLELVLERGSCCWPVSPPQLLLLPARVTPTAAAAAGPCHPRSCCCCRPVSPPQLMNGVGAAEPGSQQGSPRLSQQGSHSFLGCFNV